MWKNDRNHGGIGLSWTAAHFFAERIVAIAQPANAASFNIIQVAMSACGA
jgi:hypothetical protein